MQTPQRYYDHNGDVYGGYVYKIMGAPYGAVFVALQTDASVLFQG